MLIGLWLLFGVFISFCKNFESLAPLYSFVDRFCVTLPLGYIGYFVLGYELNCANYFINKTSMKIFAVTSIAMVMISAMATSYLSVIHGRFIDIFYDYMSPTVVVYSACLFLIVKRRFAKNEYYNNQWYNKYVVLMSKYSLAIYMFHEFILIFVQKFGINPTIFNPLISVPVIALGVYMITYFSVHILSKIHFFKENMM